MIQYPPSVDDSGMFILFSYTAALHRLGGGSCAMSMLDLIHHASLHGDPAKSVLLCVLSSRMYIYIYYNYIFIWYPKKKTTFLLFLAVFAVNSAYFDVDFLSTSFR